MSVKFTNRVFGFKRVLSLDIVPPPRTRFNEPKWDFDHETFNRSGKKVTHQPDNPACLSRHYWQKPEVLWDYCQWIERGETLQKLYIKGSKFLKKSTIEIKSPFSALYYCPNILHGEGNCVLPEGTDTNPEMLGLAFAELADFCEAHRDYLYPEVAQADIENWLSKLRFFEDWGERKLNEDMAKALIRRQPHLKERLYEVLDLQSEPIPQAEVSAAEQTAPPSDSGFREKTGQRVERQDERVYKEISYPPLVDDTRKRWGLVNGYTKQQLDDQQYEYFKVVPDEEVELINAQYEQLEPYAVTG